MYTLLALFVFALLLLPYITLTIMLVAMRKQTFISIIFLSVFSLTHMQAKACECFNISFTADSDNADLIFEGTAIDRKDSLEIGKVYYAFRLDKVWKGNQYQNITIKTNYGGPACGAFFEVGKEYVVFATNLETTRCRRNSEIENYSDIPRLNYKYDLSYRQRITLDNSAVLSQFEGDYFKNLKNDIHFQNNIFDSINFAGSKIAFLDNNDFITKQEFFNRYGDKSVILTFEKIQDNKMQQNGSSYGIFIIHRKIKMTKRQKKKIIHELL